MNGRPSVWRLLPPVLRVLRVILTVFCGRSCVRQEFRGQALLVECQKHGALQVVSLTGRYPELAVDVTPQCFQARFL
jgi:hypothetical protein